MIVAKFGGSSMADAKAMRRSAKVAFDQENMGMVIVSATYGTTNDLVELGQYAPIKTWAQCKPIFKRIEERHYSICEELGADDEMIKQVRKLLTEAKMMAKGMNYLKDCSPKAMDGLLSVGERISSTLFVLAMREVFDREVIWFDAREALKTDDQFGRALPELNEISRECKNKLKPLIDKGAVIVSQGFIGSTKEGLTTTLGRGGSDYSAALFAEGLEADLLQIWTDVAGVATTDPRICENAQPIAELSFTEAAELATFGAKVLHPTTVWPAMRGEIPVFVGSSYESEARGTMIKESTESSPLVRAIALREKQTLISITTPRMVQVYGYLANIFEVFKRHKVPIDLVTTSEISVAITVNDSELVNPELHQELNALGNVHREDDLSLVSLIGNNINHTSGLGNQVLDAIDDINIRLVSSGASKHNFCVLLEKAQAKDAIKRLHAKFLE